MKALWKKEWIAYGRTYIPIIALVILAYLVLSASMGMFVDALVPMVILIVPPLLSVYLDAENGWHDHACLCYRRRDVVRVKYITAMACALSAALITGTLARSWQIGAEAGACTAAISSIFLFLSLRSPSSKTWTMACAVLAGFTAILVLQPIAAQVIRQQYKYYGIDIEIVLPDPLLWIVLPLGIALAGWIAAENLDAH